MLKPDQSPDDKFLLKTKCKCGRKIVVARQGFEKKEFLCDTCKTHGVEESRRMFLQIGAESDKTIFEINLVMLK